MHRHLYEESDGKNEEGGPSKLSAAGWSVPLNIKPAVSVPGSAPVCLQTAMRYSCSLGQEIQRTILAGDLFLFVFIRHSVVTASLDTKNIWKPADMWLHRTKERWFYFWTPQDSKQKAGLMFQQDILDQTHSVHWNRQQRFKLLSQNVPNYVITNYKGCKNTCYSQNLDIMHTCLMSY